MTTAMQDPRPALPSAPDRNNVRTYYAHPMLDRLTGHYTVDWENAGGHQRIRVHNRLRDMEGHRPSLRSLMKLPAVMRSYLATRKHPIMRRPLPFLVWDAIDFLEKLVGEGSRVLEVGSGNSTLWFLERGARVTSIEHSSDWAGYVRDHVQEHLGEQASKRLTYCTVQGADAIRQIESAPDASYDIVLVDSMNAFTYRKDALVAARSKVAEGGWMVLDNSDHPNNWAAVDLMQDRERVRFSGYAPMASVVCQTSFWRM